MATRASKPGGRVKRVAKKKVGPRRVSAGATVEEVVRGAPGVGTRRRGRTLFVGSARKSDVNAFLRQLVMLLEAGTPILKSLKTLSDRGRPALRALVGDIAEYVEAGNPLWQAFDRHPRQFDTVFVNMIKASEASGTLTTVLDRLAAYREQREILKKRVRGALAYPVVLLVACVLVIVLLVKFVIPGIQELFTKFDVELPWYTETFIKTSNFIGGWGGIYIVLVIVALIVLYKLLVLNRLWRLRADRLKLRIPLIGGLAQKNAIVQLTRTLSLLLSSGLSMMATLELVRNAVRNQAVCNVVQHLRDSVERGEGLEDPLREVPGVIPPVVTDMLVTGEESGRLDKIADQVADVYDEEVRITINTMGELLQPILTIFLGIIVLLLVLSVLGPLIEMIQKLSEAGGGAGSGAL
ncbi:MAG TPA: type II secretion system F family protein [Candidatus Hydrogenedentes bacterium]|nr:type II secretion system F family protein [Candidatus Hydrogenedentota bacterium]HIJ73963.1 type II secretion system F family protein [Candidatus Hydrogenedentota bacterium]